MTNRLLRAADADRHRTVGQLTEAYAAGRLTLTEFEHRMTAALAARTFDELDGIVEDLPMPADLERVRELTDELLAVAAELGVSRAHLVVLLTRSEDR
jgi:hypothetical protein